MTRTISLSDTTFIIPIRIDSFTRLENLLAVIHFIKKFDCKLIIIESITSNVSFTAKVLPKSNISYIGIKDEDVIFFRTHYINLALNEVHTPYVAVWDADVLVSTSQIATSIEALRSGNYEVSFPYNGIFLNTDYVFRSKYLVEHDFSQLIRYKKYFNRLYGKKFVGGGFLINKGKYIQAGKENENFYGWGPEDLDRVQRWEAMGYRIHRSAGPMIHLCHPRDINGGMRSELHQNICMRQLQKSQYASSVDIETLNKQNTNK